MSHVELPGEGPPDVRRRIVDRVLAERGKHRAAQPIGEEDAPSGSPLWPAGLGRLLSGTLVVRDPLARRGKVLEIAAVVLAWLESIEREIATRGLERAGEADAGEAPRRVG